ncbi:hypothetical protein BD410DRAFT_894088 [Rickenella mellea]|uniref:C2 NT-type domain-containing protein n=1 Tax=Rickenella mellea TaxID=50990 RepID=A0A4Y7QJX7_9AGAM|nr:hypothetical protein BD410DRAFT_894088 [Rickenella mellea]
MNTIKPSSKMSSAYSTASSSMVMTPSTSTSGVSQASSTKTDGTATPGGSSSLRTQLYHLLPLPRHALFNARIHIKQLYNVPLIKGEFAAKWRIQNVTSHAPGGSILGKVRQKHKEHKEEWMRRRTSDKGKGKGKENEGAEEAEPEHEKDGGEESDSDADDGVKDTKTVASHSSSSRSIAPSSSSQSSQSSPRMNAFNLATQPQSQSPTHSQSRSSTLNTSISDTNSSEISTSDTAMTTSTTGSTTNASMSTTNDPNIPAPAKGRTAYVPLKDHNVLWDQTLSVGVQIGVQRETLDLLPSELKIVVVQRVIHGDPDAPHNPRLGAVYLNLAEYANTGPIERRYLLRESKTNATLQMTIELTHTGGEKSYHPPPLQKGEVMARVTGLLQREIGLGAGLDGYDYDMALFSSAFGSRLGSGHGRPGWSRSSSGASTNAGGVGFGSGGGGGKGVGAVTIGRSKNRSGGKGGFGAMAEAARVMQTTDNIIEAIFNPVPSTSSRQSPFTYYVPPVEREEHTDEGRGERHGVGDVGKGSVVVLDRELDGTEDGGDRDGKESESGHTSHSGHAHRPHSRTHSRTASHSSTDHSSSAHSHLTVPGTPGTTSDDQQHNQHARPSENWKWWRKLSHSRPSSPVNGVHPVNAPSSLLRSPSRSRPGSPMHPPPPPLPSLPLASVPPPLALRTQSSSTTSSSRPSSPLSGVFFPTQLQRPSSPKTARPPVPKTPLPPTPDTARPGQHLRLRPPPQRKSAGEDETPEEKCDAGKATYLGVPTA